MLQRPVEPATETGRSVQSLAPPVATPCRTAGRGRAVYRGDRILKQPTARSVLILADDLTGAADAAAAFVGRARRITVALQNRSLVKAEVVATDLNTRHLPERQARRRVRIAFGGARARRAAILFKKIDSTLRGHVLAELLAAREALGRRRPVIFAPAFPAQRRIVRGGRLFVDDQPCADAVMQALAASGITPCDAESDHDLDAIARRGLAMRPRPWFAGSAGLARALARREPRRAPPRVTVPWRPVVTVVGSASPVSARQTRRLARSREARADHVLVALESPRNRRSLDPRHAQTLSRIVAGAAPRAHLVLTGGETARAVLAALGVREFRVLGEVEPGVPYGVTPCGTLVCTKAGAFGEDDILVRCVRRLRQNMGPR